MLKKYKAKSQVSLSVPLNNGNAHITFSALTGGGSVFYTEDEDLQAALEKHPKFGRLFKEAVSPLSSEERVESSEPAAEPQISDEGVEVGEAVVEKIEVACVDDAKEYLVERYGMSRTKLRSTKAIKEAAEAVGVEFVGI